MIHAALCITVTVALWIVRGLTEGVAYLCSRF